MKSNEIFQQITPFLIACPFFIFATLYYLIAIWKDEGTAIMLLPQVLILLLVSILFLTLDRVLVKHGQGILTVIEVVLMAVIYLGANYSNKSITFQPNKDVSYFQVVYPIEESKNTRLKPMYLVPFHHKIDIDQNNQSIFLSEKATQSYKLKVSTNNSYTINGETYSFKNQTYRIDFYSLQNEGKIDTISVLRKQVVWKQIEEILQDET